MHRAKDLPRDELEGIVEAVQQALYLDHEGSAFVWNPDKVWDGADVCQNLANVLSQFGLVPDQPEPFRS
jgi:hypothetical protein